MTFVGLPCLPPSPLAWERIDHGLWRDRTRLADRCFSLRGCSRICFRFGNYSAHVIASVFLRSNLRDHRQTSLSVKEIASSHTTLTCPALLSGVAMTAEWLLDLLDNRLLVQGRSAEPFAAPPSPIHACCLQRPRACRAGDPLDRPPDLHGECRRGDHRQTALLGVV